MTLARRTDNVSDAESRKRAIDEQLSHAREVFTKLARGEYGGAPQPLHGTVSLSGAGTLLPSPRAILVEERRWHQKAMSLQPPGLSISASTPDLFGDDASSLRKPSVVSVLACSSLRRDMSRVSMVSSGYQAEQGEANSAARGTDAAYLHP
jgi:hypothetical protein